METGVSGKRFRGDPSQSGRFRTANGGNALAVIPQAAAMIAGIQGAVRIVFSLQILRRVLDACRAPAMPCHILPAEILRLPTIRTGHIKPALVSRQKTRFDTAGIPDRRRTGTDTQLLVAECGRALLQQIDRIAFFRDVHCIDLVRMGDRCGTPAQGIGRLRPGKHQPAAEIRNQAGVVRPFPATRFGQLVFDLRIRVQHRIELRLTKRLRIPFGRLDENLAFRFMVDEITGDALHDRRLAQLRSGHIVNPAHARFLDDIQHAALVRRIVETDGTGNRIAQRNNDVLLRPLARQNVRRWNQVPQGTSNGRKDGWIHCFLERRFFHAGINDLTNVNK